MPPHAPCWWRWVSTPMSWHGTRSCEDGSEPTSPARTGPLETLGSGKIRSQRISQGLNVPTVSPTGGIAAGVPRVVRLPMGPAVRHRDASRGVAEVRAGETSANFRQGVVKDGTGWDRGSGTDPGDDAKSLPPPAGSRGPTPTHQRSASVEKSARRASGDRTWTEIRSMNVAGDALQAAPCP